MAYNTLMAHLTLNDIHVSFGSAEIFEQLNLRINSGEKIGLIGPNGCGKTTLLQIILGSVEPDIGDVNKRKKLRIGYLPQEALFADDKTVIEELHAGAEGILKLQKQLLAVSHSLSELSGGELKAAMRQYDRLGSEFELAGGYEYETRIKEITAGLGLDETYHDLKVSQLSGGQLSRLGFAKVLLADADLLLLDEPTNHLDWETTLWLERFLKNYNGAALIVSHDRFLLDKLVTKIAEINNRKINIYPGNYSNYKSQKAKRELELSRQYQQRAEFLDKTRDFIARNKNDVGMRKVARGRQKYLDRILHHNPDFLEKPEQNKELKFAFGKVEQKTIRTETAIVCDNLTKQFDSVTLFKNLSFELFVGGRLGIIGPNGTGKTTLLKLLLGQIEPSDGQIKIRKKLSPGYLDQAGAELDSDNTVLEEASLAVSDMEPEKLRGRLGAFLFSGDEVFKKVGDLSGGQRNRLALCKLVLSEPELLVLDEPTNHLDIGAREMLEQALRDYTGTIIVVSHDRFFLDKIADQLLVIGADRLGKKMMGEFEFVNGSYGQYSQMLQERNAAQSQKAKAGKAATRKRPKSTKLKKTTPSHLKQFNAWSIEKIEHEIIETELQIELIQEQFGDEKIYKDPGLLTQLQKDFDDKRELLALLYQAYEWRSR
jgi:ATP-binding cassette subfamily F protein 3